jgi:2-phospho-L-lactate guanylyltransferase
MEPPADRPQIAAIIPIGILEGAKSRLGGTLDAEERRDLVDTMVYRTIRAALETPGISDVLVVTPDRAARDQAAFLGARTLLQPRPGLNEGLEDARADAMAGGADAIVILPIDLPLISPDTIAELLAPIAVVADRPLVVLAPDRHGRGTNGLVLAPPDAIAFGFGGESRATHARWSTGAGARYVELEGPLALDIDTPDDLLLTEALATEPIDAR